jgi:hypothetical protein
LVAFRIVPSDALGNRLDINSSVSQVLQTFVVILSVPTQFQHENPLFPRVDLGLQDIESKIIIANQVGDDRFVYRLRGKSQYQHSGVHKNSSSLWITVTRETNNIFRQNTHLILSDFINFAAGTRSHNLRDSISFFLAQTASVHYLWEAEPHGDAD